METVKAMCEYDADEVGRAEDAIANRYARDVAKIWEIAETFSVSRSVVKRSQDRWVSMVREVCTVWPRAPTGLRFPESMPPARGGP